MLHRHLNHQGYTLASIDDIIVRGRRQDWDDLRHALLDNPVLFDKVVKVCRQYIADPYAQRYHFWFNYAARHRVVEAAA